MNTRATINIIATFENSIAQEKRALPDIHDEFQLKLNNISREVDNYILTTDKLLRISDDLKSMVSFNEPTGPRDIGLRSLLTK